MKTGKKVVSLALVLLLILSMAAVASAATVTDTYYYTVTKTSTNTTTTMVSDAKVYHVKGTEDSIPYSVSAKTYTFDQSQFSSSYRGGLLKAYANEGFSQTVAIPATSGSMKVDESRATGTYWVILTYTYGSGSWSVSKNGSSTLASGTFSSAPISYLISLYPPK